MSTAKSPAPGLYELFEEYALLWKGQVLIFETFI